jgi:4-hydroxy 2-oxovalerate aldolase
LDCTLRDGGYYTSWDFEKSIVDTYIESFNCLPVDYIELGYRSVPLPGYYGEYFYCPTYLIEKFRQKSNQRLSIMLNEKDLVKNDARNLLEPVLDLVDMVRLAVNPDNFTRALGLAEAIKEMGPQVGLNVMYMSLWAEKREFLNQIQYVDGIADYFYMVDSFGGVYPDDVREVFELVRSKTDVEIGFHGHNNLEMGLINTLTALDCGVDIVDATVCGMGRGAGNLKTEMLLTALNAKGKLDFDFNLLSSVVDTFSELQEIHRWGTNLPYMVSGANSLPQKEVMEWVGKRFHSFNSIIRALTNKTKGVEDNIDLMDFELNHTAKRVLIIGGGPSGTIHAEAVTEFLKENPGIAVIYVSSKNVQAYKNISNMQIHCLSGNEGYRLESTFGDLERGNRLAVLPPFPRKMGTYIPELFRNDAYQLRKISFTDINKDSVTVVAIQTALDLGATEINFIGYDGYSGSVSLSELELANENGEVFSCLNDLGINFCSLTNSRYSELPQSSVYSVV